MNAIALTATQEIVSNPKVAVSVFTATWWSGTATLLEWLPTGLGMLATSVGICLSIVLICTHIKKAKLDEAKHKLEMDLLSAKLSAARDKTKQEEPD